MSTKYYQAQNANRLIAGQVFEITDIVASTAFGVFQTDDPALQKQLDALVEDPKNAVYSISEAEYNAEIETKKKLPDWKPSLPSRTPPAIAAPLKSPPAGGAAKVVENPEPAEPEQVEISQGVSSVEEALTTGKVESADPPAEQAQPPAPPAPEKTKKPSPKKG